jgi:CheY-like chemotaxis protein
MPMIDEPATIATGLLAHRRFLLVDDDRLNTRILAGILKPEGAVVAEASSGEQAVELYRDFRPDLVLLDVMMPGIDGFETCRRLKERHGEDCAPIIFITSKNESSDIVQGLAAGGADYLSGRRRHWRASGCISKTGRCMSSSAISSAS